MKPQRPINLSLTQNPSKKQTQTSLNQFITLSRPSLTTNPSKTSPLTKIPKNINEYKHLLESRHLVQGDLDWTLDLRSFSHSLKPYETFRESSIMPPSFYEDDFSKFNRTRTKYKKQRDPLTLQDNPYTLAHLVKRNTKFIDESMLTFETTLRHFRLPKGVKTVSHKTQWKNYPSNKVVITNDNKSLPPLREKEKENLKKMEKYVLRNYILHHKRKQYGDKGMLLYKEMVHDNNSQSVYLGEHLSLKGYNFKYDSKNIQDIRHMLANHSNSMVKFENGLRGGYDITSREYNNKIRKGIIDKYNKLKKQKMKNQIYS